jgi:hypothetical protein
MLNVSTFGNMADIYAIVHLVPHACQHITVAGHTCYYCLLVANQGNYVRELFLKKNLEKFSLSIGVRINMIRCVVYLLRIFKMFRRLMNNPVLPCYLYLHITTDTSHMPSTPSLGYSIQSISPQMCSSIKS